MIRVADKYFLGSFIKTLLFSQLSFIVIYLVVDFVGYLDMFIDEKAPVSVILLYYYYYLPYIIVLAMPLSMLMASLYSTGQFVRYGELTALKSAGLSLYRVFLPVYIFSVIVSLFSFGFGESVVPDSQRKKSNLQRYAINKVPRRISLSQSNIHLQDSQNRIVTIANYDGLNKTAYQVSVLERKNNMVITQINAATMIPVDSGWQLREVKKRDFANGEEMYSELDGLIVGDFSFSHTDLERIQIKPDEMNIVELRGYITKLQNMGSPFTKWNVDYHHKIAFPFANLVVVLLGLPLATRSWKGGTAVGFGLSLFICFLYYIVMILSNALGYKGTIPPLAAAWCSNSLFGILGIFALVTAKK